MVQTAPFNPVEDFHRGRQNALSIQAQEQGIARENSAAPVRNQLAQLGLEQQQKSTARNDIKTTQSDSLEKMSILNNVVKALAGLPEQQRAAAFDSLEPELVKFGVDTETIKGLGFSDEMMQRAAATTQGFIQDPNSLSQLSAGQRESLDVKKDLVGAINPTTGKLKPVNEMTATQRAAAIKLRLIPGAVGSAIQTITDKGAADLVAETESALSEGKEKGKLSAQLTLKPAIQAAIKTAEAEAKANAETFTELKRAKAALPGLTDVINQLKTLAPIATNTFGGRAFNTVVQELGFGGTEGGTARAKFVSLINNQVLPLLRETFGAAFTAPEGESLKATMGDVNATVEAKIETLEAFIAQKIRSIETKERELDQSDLSTDEAAELEELRRLKAQQGQ